MSSHRMEDEYIKKLESETEAREEVIMMLLIQTMQQHHPGRACVRLHENILCCSAKINIDLFGIKTAALQAERKLRDVDHQLQQERVRMKLKEDAYERDSKM